MDESTQDSIYTKELSLPAKSGVLYEDTYAAFKKWCLKKNIPKTTEDALLLYFKTEFEPYKSSTLWTKYSMLRITINIHEGIDISRFGSIAHYIKRRGEKFVAKKILRLTKENVETFLRNADNEVHLLNKVILIIGVTGACNRQELVSLKWSNVVDHDRFFLVTLVDAESGKDRSFVIPQNEHSYYLELIRSYTALRPKRCQHDRFFINYVKDKCTPQPVGVHRIGSVPGIVARYLDLPDHGSYTCHSFRGVAPACSNNIIDILRQEGFRFSNSCPGQDCGRGGRVFDYSAQASTSGLQPKSSISVTDSSNSRPLIPPIGSSLNDVSNITYPETYRTPTPTIRERPQESENVAIKWKNFDTNVRSHFQMLLHNEQYADVKLSAEGRIIKCHKVILSSFSSYFDEVFSDTPPGHVPVIFLKGVPFWILKLLVEYMYIGEFVVEEDKLPQIFSVATELKIRGLERQESHSLSKSSGPNVSETREGDLDMSCSESESDVTPSARGYGGEENVFLSKRPKLTPSKSPNGRSSPILHNQTSETEQIIIGPMLMSPIKSEPPEFDTERDTEAIDVPQPVSKQDLTDGSNFVGNSATEAGVEDPSKLGLGNYIFLK